MDTIEYLFRGTCRGWPGNATAQSIPLTYTSTDPIVATLFAIECRNHGSAVVYVARRGQYLEVPPGPCDASFQAKECSVTLAIKPEDFASNTEAEISLDDALRILTDLGFTDLPIRIQRRSHLDDSLDESNRLGQRLSTGQILQFLEAARGGPI